MFRTNRGRILGLLLSVLVIYFLFFSSSTTTDFRRRTEQGLAAKKHPGHEHGVMQGDISDEALTKQTNDKLQNVLAKQQQQKEAPPKPQKQAAATDADTDAAEDDNVGVAGRKTMTTGGAKDVKEGAGKPKYPVADQFQRAPLTKTGSNGAEKVMKNGAGSGSTGSSSGEGGDPSKDVVREKLQEYLKKPIVIFSKSYCHHSKRAKQLLLEIYKITPAPLVVELDHLNDHLPPPPSSSEHHSDDDEDDTNNTPPPQGPILGQALQALLGQITGRRTVPNVLVGMTSIGGNDLLWDLHEKGELAGKIRELGGKRVQSVELRSEVGEDENEGGKEREGRRTKRRMSTT